MTPKELIALAERATAKIGCVVCNDKAEVWSESYGDMLPCTACSIRRAEIRAAKARLAENVLALARTLAAIEAYCRAHAHQGCNTGQHQACSDVLRILEGGNGQG